MTQRVKESFLELLKLGLWGENQTTLIHFPLTIEEWTLLYELSLSQTVEGVVYDGVLLLPKEYLPPYQVLLRWTARIDGIERYNKTMRKQLSILANGLKQNNISYQLLKGLGLAENYRKPLLRVSGDVDLYFSTSDSYKRANKLMISIGCDLQKGDHNSVFYNFNTIQVEHHTKMIDVFNPFCQKFIKNLISKEEDSVREIQINDQRIRVPSYLINQVQTNAHILKHYMGFGVGLRQFCDVARLCYVKDNHFDGEELLFIYKKIGLSKWMNVIHNFMVKDLGLEREKLPYPIESDCDTKSILQDVLHSGNFGFHDLRYQKDNTSKSKGHYQRDYAVKRIMPHISKIISLAPAEVLWYPINKVYSKLTGR